MITWATKAMPIVNVVRGQERAAKYEIWSTLVYQSKFYTNITVQTRFVWVQFVFVMGIGLANSH